MTLVFPFSISSREASIGEQARAGDVAGFGTRQVGDKGGDLIGIAIALKRCDGNQRLREVAVCRIHVSINRAGLDVVNGDVSSDVLFICLIIYLFPSTWPNTVFLAQPCFSGILELSNLNNIADVDSSRH